MLATFGSERLAALERALDRAKRGPVLPVLRELLSDFGGQANENPALLRAIYAAHASCAPVRAELQQRIRAARRLLREMFSLAQKSGEVRRDMSAQELAQLGPRLFSLAWPPSWCLVPDASCSGDGRGCLGPLPGREALPEEVTCRARWPESVVSEEA